MRPSPTCARSFAISSRYVQEDSFNVCMHADRESFHVRALHTAHSMQQVKQCIRNQLFQQTELSGEIEQIKHVPGSNWSMSMQRSPRLATNSTFVCHANNQKFKQRQQPDTCNRNHGEGTSNSSRGAHHTTCSKQERSTSQGVGYPRIPPTIITS